jgi:tight adherence protein B
MFGVGVLVVVLASTKGASAPKGGTTSRLTRLIERSGIVRLTPGALISGSTACALLAFVATLLITTVPIAAALAAILAALTPFVVLRRRASVRDRQLRRSWPDAVDALVSGVRAGMALPEALAELGRRGPDPIRPAFSAFANEYRATGSFAAALQVLQRQCADPVADRVVAAMRIAREVGGSDLGLVLRTLGTLLREDARTRGDIEARQSWTVSAARLSVAAPWITLALLCTRPEAVQAFNSAGGALVLLLAAGLSALAYRVMLAIGRLPSEPRLAS